MQEQIDVIFRLAVELGFRLAENGVNLEEALRKAQAIREGRETL